MRENRTYGSEGGEGNSLSRPLSMGRVWHAETEQVIGVHRRFSSSGTSVNSSCGWRTPRST
jgi:hypothetical protein